jgi:hypothetical protein
VNIAMRRRVRMWLATIMLLAALPALAATAADATAPPQDGLEPAWKLVSDRKGIRVYTRHTEHSRLHTFRGITRFTLADEYAFVAVLNDYASYPRWMHFVSAIKETSRESPLQRQCHLTTALPWPLADRDAVLQVNATQVMSPQQEALIVRLHSVAGPAQAGYLRMREMRGELSFRRLGNNEVEVIFEMYIDPAGYIPGWLVHVLAKDVPYFTLSRLREYVLRPQYQSTYAAYVDLRGPGRPPALPPAPSYIYASGDPRAGTESLLP